MKIFPSLISSDLLNLQKTLQLLDPHCDGYHLDIMDNHFVPNLTWGPAFINAIAHTTQKPLHLHLMVDNPKLWLKNLALTPKDSFIFHIESIQDQADLEIIIQDLAKIKTNVGIALNPKTTTSSITYLISKIDHVLVMSVEPGFSGQKFMPEVMGKVDELKQIRKDQQLSFTIGMDGGINASNIAMLAQAGVDTVGVASAIFDAPDPLEALKNLYVRADQKI